MTLTPQWLDELRGRTLLSALIGRTVKITRAGREFKACCPFHDERTPSFYINDEKGFYHCLAAETRVITRRGRVAISQLSGGRHEILSRNGQWIEAEFKDYGVQPLMEISLSRNGLKKRVFATSGHRWFVNGLTSARTTDKLRPGHALTAALPQNRSDWTMDPEGIRHGIVFGDGTMCKGVYGLVHLHGEKDAALRHFFPEQEHQIKERDAGKLYLRIYGGRAFEHFKQLPDLSHDDPYLLGFLAGYLAADGHVAKDGTVMLNSAQADVLEHVRDLAAHLGIVTYGCTALMRKGYGQVDTPLHRIHFAASSLSPELFLLPEANERFSKHTKKFDRLRWVVESVKLSNRVETVYCAEVPGEHAFALEDNILTGNCFGCSAHGDAIRWMTDQQGLPFMDAVKELAQAAGMEVPAADPRAAERAERANSLYDVMAAAAAWFTDQLQGVDGAGARSYLDKRGLTAETIAAFGLGFAPDSRSKLKTALKRFGDDKLIEAGLLISVDEKEPYDRFRGRLMIPIRDPRGRVIAFGGRILGDGEPKYLNSPDTPLFDKGRTLYNLDLAAPASRKTGRAIVVEGYMDVIALAQAGIGDVVAPLGTALTEHQIERLWRLTDAPILCFDGDAAGQKAAIRAIGRALPGLAPSRSLRFATLPEGQDPDDLVRSGGKRAMEGLLDIAEPLVEKLWRHEREAAPLATPEARAGLKRRLTEHAQAIQDGDVRGQYLQEFRARFDGEFGAKPRREWKPGGRYTPPEAAPGARAKAIGGGGIDPSMAKAILAGLIRHPALLLACSDAISALPIADPGLGQLRDVLLDAAFDSPQLDSAAINPICAQAGLAAELDQIASATLVAFSFTRDGDAEIARRDLAMAIEALAARPELDAALAAATARLGEHWDEAGFAEQTRLLEARRAAERRLASLVEDSYGAPNF